MANQPSKYEDLKHQLLSVKDEIVREQNKIRLNDLKNPESGIMFLDVISNLERISDHATNIADSVVNSIV